jgi:hypothetical protein
MTLRCPEKARMADEAEARRCILKLAELGKGQWRAYRCPHCDGWHTTSRLPRGGIRDVEVNAGVLAVVTLPGHEERR